MTDGNTGGLRGRCWSSARVAAPSGPGRRTLTATGHPRAVFQRAIGRANLASAEVSARQLGRVSLIEALELTALIALKDPRRHGRAGARWMRRYLDENESAGLDDVAFVVGWLSALGGREHEVALNALRASCGAVVSAASSP